MKFGQIIENKMTTDLWMNSVQSHSRMPTHDNIYLGVLSYHVAKKLFATLYWVYILRDPLYYKVYGSRHITVGDAQKHLSSVNGKQWHRENISQNMPELNEKITFEKCIIVNNAINTDLKNILAGLYDKFNIQFYLHNISLSCITII